MATTVEPGALIEIDEDGVATVWLNRPERLNSWSTELASGLLEVLTNAEKDPQVKGVVITGKGRAFSAGADLKNPKTHRIDNIEEFLQGQIAERGRPMFDLVSHYKKPIIAAVNGYSIGIGCLVPLCCDFIYAAESAKFQLPQVTLGVMPAYGGPLRLARAVGSLNAMEMCVTGRMVTAKEAYNWGMVSQMFPDGEVLQAALETMRAIVKKPAASVSFVRESVKASVESNDMKSAELGDAYRFMILSQLQETKNQHEAWRNRR